MPLVASRATFSAVAGMLPHRRVHRRGHEHRGCRGEKNGCGEVISKSVSRPRHEIGGCRGNNYKIRLTGKPDMAHLGLIGEGKQVGIDLPCGQGGKAKWGDELLCAFGHDAGHIDIVILQAARHLKRLISGNAASNDQQYTLAMSVNSATGGGACATNDLSLAKNFKASRINLIATKAQCLTHRGMGPLR